MPLGRITKEHRLILTIQSVLFVYLGLMLIHGKLGCNTLSLEFI